MEDFTNFFLLKDPNVRWVLLAVVLMSASSAVTGCFTFLRKRALVGDAISHAILPGICLAFIITQTKNPFFLLIGAFISGWIGLMTIDFITNNTRLKTDAALGLVLSVFYGFGVLLLTSIQNSGNATQAGLDKFLFGKAASMMQEDVIVFASFSLVLLVVVVVFFNSFRLVIFDREYAITRGMPVKLLEMLLSVLTVFAISIGIQTVGVVLMAALLITPAAAARYWTEKLMTMVALSAVFAVVSGIIGTYVSYSVPKMPTGPWIVTVLSLLTIFSVLVGRKRGVLAAWVKKRKNKRKMMRENILKALYHIDEIKGDFNQWRTLAEIRNKRWIEEEDMKRAVRQLKRRHLLETKTGGWARFTPEGIEEGRRIVRVHRLWEMYLSRYMQLPADHVHEDAEAIEHIITPEIEAELLSKLDYPLMDPHDKPIPYNSTN
ncbi:iron chelate uptake ABC transporter family permease subunit [Flammeovirgaceae bacterium SG7u.111]|nr:iron chelate uptake ABC transporter family permease subunit [Flammeovirgaceae bacterium SG7u.132]WPO38132.1 iron chelate uptake ABC transporter family permease subunit [Flammeovirgaceae bacterium SG7u.111]